MGVLTGWVPPDTQGVVTWTPAWRMVRYGLPTGDVRLYVALSAGAMQAAYELLYPLLEERQVDHRHVRNSAVLEQYADHKFWADKAIILAPAAGEWETLARELDQMLAGRGFDGPAMLAGCAPFGGQSGLLFYRGEERAPSGLPGGTSREKQLSKLLSW